MLAQRYEETWRDANQSARCARAVRPPRRSKRQRESDDSAAWCGSGREYHCARLAGLASPASDLPYAVVCVRIHSCQSSRLPRGAPTPSIHSAGIRFYPTPVLKLPNPVDAYVSRSGAGPWTVRESCVPSRRRPIRDHIWFTPRTTVVFIRRLYSYTKLSPAVRFAHRIDGGSYVAHISNAQATRKCAVNT